MICDKSFLPWNWQHILILFLFFLHVIIMNVTKFLLSSFDCFCWCYSQAYIGMYGLCKLAYNSQLQKSILALGH